MTLLTWGCRDGFWVLSRELVGTIIAGYVLIFSEVIKQQAVISEVI